MLDLSSFLLLVISHLRGLCDTFALPGALRVTEAAAWLHTAAGLHGQVETQGDLRGCGGAHTQDTYQRQRCSFRVFVHSFICNNSIT